MALSGSAQGRSGLGGAWAITGPAKSSPVATAAAVKLRSNALIRRHECFSGGSLYKFLRDRRGIALARSSVVIAAIAANASQAALLKVRKGTPLLLLREPPYDVSGRPVLFAVNYHNSDIVQFTVTRAGLRA